MPNNILVLLGAGLMLFSVWIYGGILGVIVGLLLFIVGAFIGNEYSSEPNYKLISSGGLFVFIGLFIGTVWFVTGGTIIMLVGVFLPGANKL